MPEEVPQLSELLPSQEELPEERTLRSWKEIARYMNRGVRTVQRWEKTLHLPVHRREPKSEVFAVSTEVDTWFQSFAKNSRETGDADAQQWREVAEQASREEDPEKLMQLINELNHLLGQSDSHPNRNRRHPTHGPPRTAV